MSDAPHTTGRDLSIDDGPGSALAKRRLALFGTGVMVLLAVLVLRLWFLQVVGAQSFQSEARANSIRTQIIPATRGVILDRKGRPLATNRDGWDIVGVPVDLNTDSGMKMLVRLGRALGENPARMQRAVRQRARSARDGGRPFALASDISADSPLYLAVNERIGDFPGIRLQRSAKRDYPDGAFFSHLIGSVGPIPAERAEAMKKAGYRSDAIVGTRGLEQYYESYLAGQDGSRKIEVDAAGNPTDRGVIAESPARSGDTIQTSIDLDVQKALAQALREKVLLNGAQYSGGGGVVLNIQTGQVVALASYPFLDPNKISAGKAPNYTKDRRKPEINRALSAYPPASTMKPITAIAGMNAGVFTPTELIESKKKITIKGQVFKNFRDQSQGFITLPTALAVSSDTYFYQVADRIFTRSSPDEQRSGQNELWRWARTFGFGQPTNIDLMPGESRGVLPDRLWRYENPSQGTNVWREGDTVNMGVGQGDLTVTPLQLARAYSAILDPGHRLQTPTLVTKIVDPTSQQTVFEPAKARNTATAITNLTPEMLDPIMQGMVGATSSNDGTAATVFGRFGGLIAGKTGTAEVTGRPDHAWFVGYGPATPNLEPKYVVAVVVEYAGLGGAVAAPIACTTMAVALEADPARCGKGSTKAD